MADVIVTPATDGSSISADTTGGSFTDLTGPSISEGATADISAGTISLNAPSGFIFDSSASVIVSVSGTGTGTDIVLDSANAVVTDTTITITVNSPSASAAQSTLTWSGIRVRPSAGTPLATGNIMRNGTSTFTVAGMPASEYGSLTEVFGAAAQLGLQTQPSVSATAGVEFATQPAARVEDQFGNLVSSDNSTVVTAVRNAGLGILQGTTAITAASGMATFTNLFHQVAGTITIKFTNAALSEVTSGSILVSAAAATHLQFTQEPGNESAGKLFSAQPIVKAVDSFGNLTTAGLPNNLDMTISLSSGTGLLFGQKILDIGTLAGNGVVSFTNLEVNNYGNKQLTASASGLTSAVTSTFTNIGTPQRYLLLRTYPAGNSPRAIRLGNFRSNGNARDMVVANYSDNTTSIRLCNDDGGFSDDETVVSSDLNPTAVAIADFNQDVAQDLAIANFGTNKITVVFSPSSGGIAKSFTVGATVSPGPMAIEASDLNRDGRVDLVIANATEKSVSTLFSVTNSSFSNLSNYTVGVSIGSMQLVDLNGDHVLDVLLSNPDQGTARWLAGATNGSFGAPQTITLFPDGTRQAKVVWAADLNGDGNRDLVTVNYASNSVSIFLNNGFGSYVLNSNYNVGTKPAAIFVRDLDQDGKTDLVVANSGSGTIDILMGNGNGTFTSGETIAVGSNPTALTGNNFDSDGLIDLAVVNTGENNVSDLLYSAPSGVAQTIAVYEDTPKAITLGYKALEPMHVTYQVADNPTNGTLTGTPPSLIYTPGTNYVGRDTFTFQVIGGGITSGVAKVVLNVTQVDDQPSFDLATNVVSVPEDSGSQTITNFANNLSSGPGNESTQSFTFLLTNSNPGLFAVRPAISPTGTLTFKSATNANGTNIVSVVVRDNGSNANGGTNQSEVHTFQIVITPVNDAPVIQAISAKTILEDGSTNFSLKISDIDNSADQLTVTAISSNTGLIPNENLVVNRSGTNWSLSITPAANANGSAMITVMADDGVAATSLTCSVTVPPVNDAPSFDLSAATITAVEDSVLQTVAGFAVNISKGPADESSQTVSFVATATNKAFFYTQPAISPIGTLTFRPAQNVTGTNYLTVRLKDSGNTLNGGTNQSPVQTFSVVIVPDPVKPLDDSYNGLFFETNAVSHHNSGFFNFTLSLRRAISGKMLIEGGSYSFSGQFDSNGFASVIVPRTGKTALTATFQLDLTNNTDRVEGSVTDGNWTTALSGDRAITNLVDLAPGKYTVALISTNDGSTAPGGSGYGFVTLATNGSVMLTSGLLSDNTAVSQSIKLSKHKQWPLYISLYGGRGSLLGWITITNGGINRFLGNFSWIKTNAYGTYYTSGFTNFVSTTGSPFSIVNGIAALNATNGIAVVSGGNLAGPLTSHYALNTNSLISIWSTTNHLSLSLNKSTGAITGSFVSPVTQVSTPIRGVLIQTEDAARGFFYSGTRTGAFWLGTE